MRVYLDCEFNYNQGDLSLISLAMVDDYGDAFYAEQTPVIAGGNEWLDIHVVPKLWVVDRSLIDKKVHYVTGKKDYIGEQMKVWLKMRGGRETPVQMIGDVYAHDWLLFCDLMGGFFLPDYLHYIPLDLATLLYAKGMWEDVDREGFAGLSDSSMKHNALWDARVLRKCWLKLEGEKKS